MSSIPPWLDEVLADFTAMCRTTYLDDPLLNFGHAALDDTDELDVPRFSPQIPRVPVALFERHQALWTHPQTAGGRQEVWTANALRHGMARIPGPGVQRLPTLDRWSIVSMSTAGGLTVRGLQLQQPDGSPFVYAVHEPDPGWLDAAARGWVLVLHGPQLGLRDHDPRPPGAYRGRAQPGPGAARRPQRRPWSPAAWSHGASDSEMVAPAPGPATMDQQLARRQVSPQVSLWLSPGIRREPQPSLSAL